MLLTECASYSLSALPERQVPRLSTLHCTIWTTCLDTAHIMTMAVLALVFVCTCAAVSGIFSHYCQFWRAAGTMVPENLNVLLKSQIARRQMQQGHMGYDRPETPLLLKTATSGCLIKTSKSCMVLYGIRSLLALSACIACVNMHTTFHSTRCGVAAQDWQQLQPVHLLICAFRWATDRPQRLFAFCKACAVSHESVPH